MLVGNVLVVDDDEAVRVTVGAVLAEAGLAVTLAPDAADAIARLRDTEFDLVLTDLRLEDGIDGLQVLKAARRQWPDTMTLMLTGFASVESAIGALRCGAYDYLCKPCSPEELLATVERALGHRRLTIQVRQQLRDLETTIETARELHSMLSARVEGTTALLREREHVLATVCNELRTTLITIAGLVDMLLARFRGGADEQVVAYVERIQLEAQALAQRVTAALQITQSESIELPISSMALDVTSISLDDVFAPAESGRR